MSRPTGRLGSLAGDEALRLDIYLGERVRCGSRRGWRKTRLIQPFIERYGRVAMEQVFLQIVDENPGRDALKLEVLEVLSQKGIELLAAEFLFQASQKQRALFVWDRSDAVVRVAAFEIDMEKLIAGRELGHLALQFLPAERGFHLLARAAVELFENPALDVNGESLVKPEHLLTYAPS